MIDSRQRLDLETPAPPPAASPAGLPAGSRMPGVARRFFGVAARPRTYLNFVYLMLAFPLGVFYFSFFVSMLATALSTIIVWIGIPLFALTAILWWVFAALERYLADGLLGTHLTPAPQPWRRAVGTWPRIKAHLGAPATWKDLFFLFVKFPLGIASFVVVTATVFVPLVFLTAPLSVNWADWSSTPIRPEERGFYLQQWHVDSSIEALVLVPVGIVLLFLGLHLVNATAALWRMAAGALLERADPARGGVGAAAAAPPAPPGDVHPAALPQPPAGWTPTYAPGAVEPTTSYLNVPRAGEIGVPAPLAAPASTAPVTAPVTAPGAAIPPVAPDEPAPETPIVPESQSPPADAGPGPQSAARRPHPPKPPIWEDDDA